MEPASLEELNLHLLREVVSGFKKILVSLCFSKHENTYFKILMAFLVIFSLLHFYMSLLVPDPHLSMRIKETSDYADPDL